MKKSERLPWFPCDPAKLLGAMSGMSADESLIYVVCLLRIYESGGPIADDIRAISLRCHLTPSRVSKALDALISMPKKLRRTVDGKITNEVAEETLSAMQERRSVASQTGRIGADKKWQDNRDRKKTRSERLADARKKGVHTEQQWLRLLAFCGSRCLRCDSDTSIVKDHIVPIYQGGSDGIENLQPLCQSCNASKGPDTTDHRPNGWKSAILSMIDASDTQASTSETPSYLQLHEESKKDSANAESCRVASPPSLFGPNVIEAKAEVDDWPSSNAVALDRFWNAYPPQRRTEKAKVGKKLEQMRRSRAVTWAALMAGLERYKRSSDVMRGFAKGPMPWLNGGCWDDEIQTRGAEHGAVGKGADAGIGFAGLSAQLRARGAGGPR